MKKTLTVAAVTVSLVSCAPVEQKSNYDLQWNKATARLFIADETGRRIPAFEGKYVAVEGFVLSKGQIRMHPGKQRIGYICPLQPGDPEILDVAPSVVYDFKAGQQYELACRKGAPSIRQLDDVEP